MYTKKLYPPLVISTIKNQQPVNSESHSNYHISNNKKKFFSKILIEPTLRFYHLNTACDNGNNTNSILHCINFEKCIPTNKKIENINFKIAECKSNGFENFSIENWFQNEGNISWGKFNSNCFNNYSVIPHTIFLGKNITELVFEFDKEICVNNENPILFTFTTECLVQII